MELLKSHDTSQGRTDLGYIYYRSGNYENAARQFIKALNKESIYLAAYYYRAKTWGKMGSYKAAEWITWPT